MRKVFDYWDWEDTIGSLVVAIIICLVIIGIIALTSDHTVKYYYLDGDSNMPVIKADVNWGEDLYIKTPQLTFKEATELIDSLNVSLNKIKNESN